MHTRLSARTHATTTHDTSHMARRPPSSARGAARKRATLSARGRIAHATCQPAWAVSEQRVARLATPAMAAREAAATLAATVDAVAAPARRLAAAEPVLAAMAAAAAIAARRHWRWRRGGVAAAVTMPAGSAEAMRRD